MSDARIIPLPEGHAAGRKRRQLANYLRLIADGIERDQLETEPHAYFVVLTGVAQHEVLYAGYADDADGFHGALWAAQAVHRRDFKTRGGNVRKREGGPYGRAYRNDNVVEFGAPRGKPEPTP